MKFARFRLFAAAGAFFAIVSAYLFISFLNALEGPWGSSNGWMLVFACAFLAISYSLGVLSRR